MAGPVTRPFDGIDPQDCVKHMFEKIGVVHDDATFLEAQKAIAALGQEHLVEAQKDRSFFNFTFTNKGDIDYASRQIGHIAQRGLDEAGTANLKKKEALEELLDRLGILTKQVRREKGVQPEIDDKVTALLDRLYDEVSGSKKLNLQQEVPLVGMRTVAAHGVVSFSNIAILDAEKVGELENDLRRFETQFNTFFTTPEIRRHHRKEYETLENDIKIIRRAIVSRKKELNKEKGTTSEDFRERMSIFVQNLRVNKPRDEMKKESKELQELIKKVDEESLDGLSRAKYRTLIRNLEANHGRLSRKKETVFALDNFYEPKYAPTDFISAAKAGGVAAAAGIATQFALGAEAMAMPLLGVSLGTYALVAIAAVAIGTFVYNNIARGGRLAEFF